MLRKYLIPLLIILSFQMLYAGSERKIAEERIIESGFLPEDFNFKKDWAQNDSFRFPLSDTFLNDPLLLIDKREQILDSISSVKVLKKYSKINSVFSLIDTFADDVTKYIRKSGGLSLEKSRDIVQIVPMMFNEESLSYKYKGSIERNLNYAVDTNNLSADSMLGYAYFSKTDYFQIKPYVYAFIERVKDLYGEGLLYPCDTALSAGRVVIGDIHDDEYADNYDFIIELGGNDRYVNQSGVVYPYTMRTKCIIDFSGDDEYLSTDSFAVTLGAVNGVQFACDLEGDDRYITSNISAGAAFIGFSSLIDCKGNDYYNSGYFSQGAGFFGYGELIDKSGDDYYTSSAYSQGFGFVKGTGLLVDSSGNDTYRAGTFFTHDPLLKDDYLAMSQGFGLGLRPDAAGGLGILADYEGSDIYSASVFGQGSSYWHSLGLLFDFSGNDYYQSAEYAQGAGIHLSVGGLFDSSGDDMYFSRFGPSQGEGHDFAVGILIDSKGNDNYTVSGGQGSGLNNSVGIMMDLEGDDSYYSRENFACGDVNESRGFSSMALFMDMEGADVYSKPQQHDSMPWLNKYYGIGYDAPHKKEAEKLLDTFKLDRNMPIKKLFETASEWDVRENKFKVDKARQLFNNRGSEAYEYITKEKLNTDDGLELRCMSEFFKANPFYMSKLASKIDESSNSVRKNILYIIYETKYKNAYREVKGLLKSSDADLARLAVLAIGAMDTSVDLSYMKDVYLTGNYRIKAEVCDALKKHRYDMVKDFTEILSKEKSRAARNALSAYLSEFPSSLGELHARKSLTRYEEYITIYKIISKEENRSYSKQYADWLKKISEKNSSDKINVKGIKGRIRSVIKNDYN